MALIGALIVIGVVVLVVLPGQAANARQPVEVVKGFAGAIEAKDPSKMLSYVEPTTFRRELGAEVRAYMTYVDQIRFTNARYELVDTNGELAHVRWTATMDYKLRELGSGQKQIDNLVELTYIEGAWYLRSVALPDVK